MSKKKLQDKECQQYEVEVRAYISDTGFDNLLVRLTNLFGKPEVAKMKTFLFCSQNGYNRILAKASFVLATLD
jgi:hypothetical protein